jgi:hypothetical protein
MVGAKAGAGTKLQITYQRVPPDVLDGNVAAFRHQPTDEGFAITVLVHQDEVSEYYAQAMGPLHSRMSSYIASEMIARSRSQATARTKIPTALSALIGFVLFLIPGEALIEVAVGALIAFLPLP